MIEINSKESQETLQETLVFWCNTLIIREIWPSN